MLFKKIKEKLNSKKNKKTKEEIDAEFYNSPEYNNLCKHYDVPNDPNSVFDVKITHITTYNLQNE
jgi:hypothetical protein